MNEHELAGVLADAYTRYQDDDDADGSIFESMAAAALEALSGKQ